LIASESARHKVDADLVWSIMYEETYFSPWKRGDKGEIGLMQVTPTVAREWVAESGAPEVPPANAADPETLLTQPERNVQIGSWYLGKFGEQYKNTPGREARMLAAYNAGNSRVVEWARVPEGTPPLNEQQFIERIDIPSTRAYVTSILRRYHEVKSARARQPLRRFQHE
ncbi:MAG TPA: transglycosylase SLT domain-containing protein, partial [Pyrinomonadaceae bacterium]|nr:transglycosylase SLT domain-containing protein [Pyrinomonadaceae bacterium]